MDIIVKGTPDQKFTIPDVPPATDLKAINAALADLDSRMKKLEASPVPIPTPPSTARRLFSPTSYAVKMLGTTTTSPKSVQYVSELVLNSKTKDRGGIANYLPAFNVTQYTSPFFKVTDASIPKSKISVEDIGQPPKTGTELYKTLQTEGFRLPPDIYASSGTDGAFIVWDLIDDSILGAYRYRIEGGVKKIAWGEVLKDVSNHPGFIATLPNGEKQGSRASGIALPVGLIMLDELIAGKIPHAIAMAIPRASKTWVAPAQRTDGSSVEVNAINMGQCFRFPSGFVPDASYAPIMRMLIEAVRDYGLYVGDTSNGQNIAMSCEDIIHKAPAGTTDKIAWAKAQYAPFFTANPWAILSSPTLGLGGQFPWDNLVALA